MTKKISEKMEGLKGSFKIYLYPPEQKMNYKNYLVTEQHNLIVTTGKTIVRNLISGFSTDYLQSFAVGTGTTTPVVGDTGLETPVTYDATNTYKPFLEYNNDTATVVTFVGYLAASQPDTQPVDLTEIGLFTGTYTSVGTMYSRATFDAVTKTSALELRFEYSLEF